MGSKKLKKWKTKCRKLHKLYKSKAAKFSKKNTTRELKELCLEKTLEQKNISDRLFDNEKFSHCIHKKYISNVKTFSQIREHYFCYLQTVVSNNCGYYNSNVTKGLLENLSLELEQHAILACLQADIYKKCIKKIISDIEKCTEDEQIHSEIKRLLPQLVEHDTTSVKAENSIINPPTETYSQIPTIATSRTDDDLHNTGNGWTEGAYHSEGSDFNHSFADQYGKNLNEFHESYQSQNLQSWNNTESDLMTFNESKYWSNGMDDSQINEVNVSNEVTPVPVSELSGIMKCVQDNNNQSMNSKAVSKVPPQTLAQVDPLFKFRKQLQKSVEQSLTNLEKLNIQKKDDKERAYIAQILEGDDSLDDGSYDSLSGNESESKENVDESNLMDRLEKMRELFGVGYEDSYITQASEKAKISKFTPIQEHPRKRRSTVWKHEKVIQLHKLSMLAFEMTPERRTQQQKLFLKLFGEDSDEENEAQYHSEEKYRTSCTERISSWVVKYLMPFYHDKRIIGRNVFKCLGHYISDCIVDKIQYPDEWTVQYFVSKFFPPRKRYVCDADIVAFQFD